MGEVGSDLVSTQLSAEQIKLFNRETVGVNRPRHVKWLQGIEVKKIVD